MALFFALAGAIALATAGAVLLPLWLNREAERSRAARDAAVYRDQLEELDRDVARGLVSEGDAAGSRAEIARRLIAAQAKAERTGTVAPAPWAASRPVGLAALVLLPLAGLGVYLAVGAPALPDRPFAERPVAEQRAGLAQLPGQETRPSQAEAEAAAAERRARGGAAAESPVTAEDRALLERLETVLEGRPEDVEGRRLLAGAYMRRGRHAEAAEVFGEIAAILGPRAEGELFESRAEAMILAADGYVSPEAERALETALRLDPGLPVARYYAGIALAQQGNLPDAVRLWERLAEEAPRDAPWRPAVLEVLAEARMAMRGQGGPGPTAEEMEAAAAVSPEERAEMIAGMVARLDDRLDREGGTPEEWVRLIRARVQLGQREAAREAFARSQEALSGSEAGFVREQALLLGVIEE